MKPTLDEEIRRIAKAFEINFPEARDVENQVTAAIHAGIEAWKRQEPTQRIKPIPPVGWLCPKCGRTNAPEVLTCRCGPDSSLRQRIKDASNG